MTTSIKHFVRNGEIEWCLCTSEGWRGAHSTLEDFTLEVDVPVDEAMKWFEAFNFNSQDFFEAVHINDKDVSAVFTSMSGVGTGRRFITFEFSLLLYSIPNVKSNVIDFWDRFVEKTVDSIRCAVVEHELKCSVE